MNHLDQALAAESRQYCRMESARAWPRKRTWSFLPKDDIRSLMTKAINEKVGIRGNPQGVRTRIINAALRAHLAPLRGKREGNMTREVSP